MVTIGPDLSSLTPQTGGYPCSATHNCTLVNGSVGSGFGQPGLVSPVNGYITQIRVRTGPAGSGSFIFRQLTPVSGGYKGVITFGVVPNPPLPPNSILEFPGFPIDAGDAIGIDCCQGGFDDITSAAVPGSGNFLVWGTGANSLLANGETRAPDSDRTGELLMLNADIVPENHFILDKAKVKRASVKAQVTVPNAGALTVGSRLLKQATINVGAPDENARALFSKVVTFSVKTTKAGRARLRRAGKLKLQVTYTPIYGTPSSLKLTAKR
jgi:hypothetical protein